MQFRPFLQLKVKATFRFGCRCGEGTAKIPDTESKNPSSPFQLSSLLRVVWAALPVFVAALLQLLSQRGLSRDQRHMLILLIKLRLLGIFFGLILLTVENEILTAI